MSGHHSIRTIRYSLPDSSNGVSMTGQCVIVPDRESILTSSGDSLVLSRREFAAALKWWRRSDKAARLTLRQERINALLLFLLRNVLSK